MTFEDEIYLTVLRAKCASACWAENLINKQKYGEDVGCCELNLILLVKWIGILEQYWCKNFSSNGNITPDYPCLTQAQAQNLVGKLKNFIK